MDSNLSHFAYPYGGWIVSSGRWKDVRRKIRIKKHSQLLKKINMKVLFRKFEVWGGIEVEGGLGNQFGN